MSPRFDLNFVKSTEHGKDDVDTMSVKNLRTLITGAGLSHADCVEKLELRGRAREARTVLANRNKREPIRARRGQARDQPAPERLERMRHHLQPFLAQGPFCGVEGCLKCALIHKKLKSPTATLGIEDQLDVLTHCCEVGEAAANQAKDAELFTMY